MGPAEFQALMLLGGMAVQGLTILAERRGDMTLNKRRRPMR